ncbi:DUF1205 domain-containing protein [Phytohabitans sp. ZYX-F-186]|uniref:DUF1205 domain-containing protein n=1 Tax=Phytohabitans maris TaxID=3071409 RepID=A0ABU0ZK39_9ACTN|nr:nucleotide disphospho-sugar-binding domain-containing protein [Phytohabitans sp. ZYX-F-186]MDQ7907422.1 DUF1205 domain-containing protein [Phytohabitans sp. ZYX-F-186]
MKILMVTATAPSHFYPLVPVAWAARSAGHEVRVAHQPSLTAAVVASGLPSVPAGEDVDLAAVAARWRAQNAPGPGAGPDPESAVRHAVGLFVAIAEAMIDDVMLFCRRWAPDLIVYEPTGYAGHLASTALGVPAVRHLVGPDFSAGLAGTEQELATDLYKRHGVTEIDLTGDLTLDPCPPVLQAPYPPQQRQLVRYLPYNGAGQVPRWVLEEHDRPRVCVTWGTTFARVTGHLAPARRVLEALADLDVDVIAAVTAGHSGMLGEVPDRVRVVEELPLNYFLPTCSAIVHHGGDNTTLTASALGVPQLIIPLTFNPFSPAKAVATAGAGLHTDGSDPTVAALRDGIAALLGDARYRHGARRLARLCRTMPSSGEAVASLERLGGR